VTFNVADDPELPYTLNLYHVIMRAVAAVCIYMSSFFAIRQTYVSFMICWFLSFRSLKMYPTLMCAYEKDSRYFYQLSQYLYIMFDFDTSFKILQQVARVITIEIQLVNI